MQSKARTVDAYLASLPDDRRSAVEAVRKVIRENLPTGYEEGMQYGMIGYFVPHSVYPPGYHCDPKQPLPFAGLASQKNHMSMYLMCIYADPNEQAAFRKAWMATGKKLDMGKACIRFKKLEDVPLDVVGEAVRRIPVDKFLAFYESTIKTMGKRSGRSSAKKAGAKPAAGKTKPRAAASKLAAKKSAATAGRAAPKSSAKSAGAAARKKTAKRAKVKSAAKRRR